MQRYFRSDLACESGEGLEHIEGTVYERQAGDVADIERLTILTDGAAERLGRPKGEFITLFCERLWLLSDETVSLLSGELARELRGLILRSMGRERLCDELSVLVVGLGNTSITADALGPMAAEHITITRHIREYDEGIYGDIGMCEVSAVCPSVLGKTGIESVELVRAAVDEVDPDVIIAIDALAAGSVERLATTIQLSDTGINPGAGIGNLRRELSMATLGAPVIALGIPTVVDSSTLICDALTRSGIDEIPRALTEHLENSRGYYVTPKETDLIARRSADVIAEAINSALVI